MEEKNKQQSSKFSFWYERIFLICIAVSIVCNIIQIAGGFPSGMWQFGFVPVAVCLAVAGMRDIISEGRPNLSPIKINRPKYTLLEIVIRYFFIAVWAVSLIIVIVIT